MWHHCYFIMFYIDSFPVVPVAFLLHERKFELMHEDFMTLIKKKI